MNILRYGTVLACLLFLLLAAGCKKDDNPVNTAPSLDQNLIGDWWSSADQDGVEIKSDGTWLPLTTDANHKVTYAAVTAGVTYQLTTPQTGSFILTLKGKSTATGKDTTLTSAGTYAFGANNNTVTIVLIASGQTFQSVYTRTSIGAVVTNMAATEPRRLWLPTLMQ